MPERKHCPRQPAELLIRGVRLFKENRPDYSSDSAAYASITEKLGCSRFTLRQWCIQAERDAGERPGRSSADKARIKELEREVKESRTANEILKKTPACFAQAKIDRPFRRWSLLSTSVTRPAESSRSAVSC